MSPAIPTIRDVLYAFGSVSRDPDQACLSLGLLLDDASPGWGEALVSRTTAASRSAIETSISRLRGQRVDDLRAYFRNVSAEVEGLDNPDDMSAVVVGLQQAGVAAAANRRGLLAAAVLAEAYGLDAPIIDRMPRVFLEASDFAATALLYERIINGRPDGIGYRLTGEHVAEAIGLHGEYLQAFVRQLTQRVAQLSEGEAYRPAIYLGINGALGVLSGDPERHIGKILGNLHGLRVAAGEHEIFFEDPFNLADLTARNATFSWLRKALQPMPGSRPLKAEARLVAGEDWAHPQEWTAPEATDATSLIFPVSSDLDVTLRQLAVVIGSGRRLVLRTPHECTRRQTRFVADVALALGAEAVVVNVQSTEDTRADIVTSHLAETAAWLQALRGQAETS